jgi:hypothetical protein
MTPNLVSTAARSGRRQAAVSGTLRHIVAAAATVLLFSALAACIQVCSGSYQAEFSSYPDEPAHVVTGVAFEQYLLHRFGHSPVVFLLDYYKHYPKVAIGHWPPLLYLAEAAAMLVAGASRYSLLGLEALFAGLLAWLVFRELRPLVGTIPSALGSTALLLNRQVRQHTSMAMGELLLTLTMFLAALAFARFAEQRRTRDAIWAGIWVSAAVLTKGTGWAALMIPAAVVLANRDWRLLQAPALRPAALIIAVLCLPWQILTFKLSAEGWPYRAGLSYTFLAVSKYSSALVALPGFAISLCAVVGLNWAIWGSGKIVRSRTYWVVLAGAVASPWLLLVLVPAALESRYLLVAVPPVFILAAAGTNQFALWIFPSRTREASGVIFAFVALLTIELALPLQAKPQLGFVPVAVALERMLPEESAALVVSDIAGEGGIVSEMALRRPWPAFYLIRGTKLLASQDWNGGDYRPRITSADDCERLLASIPVRVLVMDRRSSASRQPFFDIVEAMLRKFGNEWRLVHEFPSPGDSSHAIAIYQGAPGNGAAPVIPRWILPRVP